MYEELIKRLRELQAITEHCNEHSCFECENRELCDKHDNKTLSGTYKEAADAIEGLSMKLHGDEAAIAGMKREIERMVVSGNKPRWIPVTERLPESGERVLVSNGKGFVCEAYLSERKRWMRHGCIVDYITPTHWMPLPQPPKEE